MTPLDQRQLELRDAITIRAHRLQPEVRWRIDLAIDISGVYPLGPNALPPVTWRNLLQMSEESMAAIARRGGPGSKLAAITSNLLTASRHLSRGDEWKAELWMDKVDLELGDLTPADLIGDPWERAHGERAWRNGSVDLLDVIGRPSRPEFQPMEEVGA